MNNIDRVVAALTEWGTKVASSFMPQVRIQSGSGLGRFMTGFLGVDLANYNPWSELGFLAEPVVQSMIAPTVSRMLSGLSDEQVKDMAFRFADSLLARAREKGRVNVFGICLESDAFEGLKGLLDKNLCPERHDHEEGGTAEP